MTVTLTGTKLAAVFGWDTNVIEGDQVSLIVAGEEKRVVKNDGEAVLFFPLNFSGTVEVTVRGSASGEETGILNIESPLFSTPPDTETPTDDTSDVEVTPTPPNVPEPAPPTDSESEIPDDASSEQGEVPPVEPLPDSGEPSTEVNPTEPSTSSGENTPSDTTTESPTEGSGTGASTVS
jgi:outer membrane biosynthesis protein TonB